MLKQFYRYIPFQNIFLDSFLVISEIFLFDNLIKFYQNQMLISFILGVIIHLIGFGTGVFWINYREFKQEKKGPLGFLASFSSMFLWFSFTWLLFPMLALSKQLGREVPGFGWIMAGVLFLSLIAGALGGSKAEGKGAKKESDKMPYWIMGVFILMMFYSESLIFASAGIMGGQTVWEKAAGIFWICIAYFPFRYQLFYQPPYSVLDGASMLMTWVYFIWELFAFY